ncbi:MAG: hypothetical protein ACFFFT_16930 [Candidatus Thorarchaeota archaeon]
MSEKYFEEVLDKFLKENKGTAYTIRALEQILKKFLRKLNKKERSSAILEILESFKNDEKIDAIQHNGELHYFNLEIFDYEQYSLHKTHYIVPDKFISAGKRYKKIKIRYCKSCKKEVILHFKFRPQNISIWFPKLSTFSEKNIEARRNTGWFCPNCGERIATIFRRVKIVLYLMGVILLAGLLFVGSISRGDLQFYLYFGAIILSGLLVFEAVRQLIKTILKKRGRKIFEDLKGKPREYLDRYVNKTK